MLVLFNFFQKTTKEVKSSANFVIESPRFVNSKKQTNYFYTNFSNNIVGVKNGQVKMSYLMGCSAHLMCSNHVT